ncbi:MAG TPA: bifunctional UDP-N-acetylglucosamine diphosphorylase/glucosamine-1-phosphate N-acetyltransferase GlmU [Burkholderiales bacterium]|jgi:bifunctional UDP-N-acetylglucosamine pyrophosphorylase/glucosamine-1-phosphate N-acetyltransferase|nr:bifunctional UDP-N-acetylglucosamine diphosphorylase/glucosamine-1-phosphate N-acetyltransferase GlmU [Burkholderiales bacterium]
MPLHVVILAAGQGKRMRSALPKVLHPLAGKPLLAHVLDAARALRPEAIHVVHGHGGEQVKAAFQGTPLHWVEQKRQLGTGHALLQALPRIPRSASVLVLNGDVPLLRAASLRKLLQSAGKGIAIMTSDLSDATGYGRVLRGKNGGVERIVEERDASPQERAVREWYAGFLAGQCSRLAGWLAKVANRNAQKEYYLTDVIRIAAASGAPVTAVKATDRWEVAGINSREELAILERAYQNAQARRLLEAGVTLADLWRVDVRGELACGSEVAIDVNCVFEGRVRLGDRVRIGPNCVLKDVTIGADTEVRAFSFLEDSSVGERCKVGPYARLRPGASLEADVHVGNFVEVKASRLGAGTKANHLAYVGDSEVGARVNIGAGTITCNYDGAQKHRTIIEDDCFIGSDATLVAPVRIRKGSYIGAGSTISKDTPAGQLTLARARQMSIPGWRPPKKAR